MTVNWSVDDGYVNNGPHTTNIDDEYLLECCDTYEQAIEHIEEEVRADFEGKISWRFRNNSELRSTIEALLASKAKETP